MFISGLGNVSDIHLGLSMGIVFWGGNMIINQAISIILIAPFGVSFGLNV